MADEELADQLNAAATSHLCYNRRRRDAVLKGVTKGRRNRAAGAHRQVTHLLNFAAPRFGGDPGRQNSRPQHTHNIRTYHASYTNTNTHVTHTSSISQWPSLVVTQDDSACWRQPRGANVACAPSPGCRVQMA